MITQSHLLKNMKIQPNLLKNMIIQSNLLKNHLFINAKSRLLKIHISPVSENAFNP